MATLDNNNPTMHLLVVIDHQEARVYCTELSGTVPVHITPYDPHGYGSHLHSADEWMEGKRLPDRKNFHEAIAKTLQGAELVLLFGSGATRSSAMEQLLADLKDHHLDVADRVVGSIVLDAPHLTEEQLLAKAREFYANFNQD